MYTLRAVLREKNSRLSRGIATADNCHVLSFTELRFHEGRAVVNSLAFEFIEVAKRRLIVLRAGGYDDGARRETVPVSRTRLEGPPCAFQAHYPVRDHHPCSELFGLHDRTCRQFLARDSCWEAQIIFDFGARSRLSAGCRGLDHEHIETLRSGVDGGCQAGRTRSHNNQVAHLRFIDGGVESETIGEFLIGKDCAGRSDRCK